MNAVALRSRKVWTGQVAPMLTTDGSYTWRSILLGTVHAKRSQRKHKAGSQQIRFLLDGRRRSVQSEDNACIAVRSKSEVDAVDIPRSCQSALTWNGKVSNTPCCLQVVHDSSELSGCEPRETVFRTTAHALSYWTGGQ